MALVFDLVIILIITLTLIITVKKGFLRTIFDFAAVICALIFSKMFAPRVSSFFYDGLYQSISVKLKEIIGGMIDNGNLPKLFEQENISAVLNKYNAGLAEKISEEAVDSVVQSISQNLVGLLSYALAYLIIFIVTVIAFKIVSVIAGSIIKLPILNKVDKTLSVVLAVILALIYVMLFVALMQILVPPLSSMLPEYVNEDIIDKTIIFDYLYNFEWVEIFVN